MPNVYHVMVGDKRTTVSLHETLAAFLAIKLKQEPNTLEAHTAIRVWLQDKLDEFDDPGRVDVSQWLQGEAIELISDRYLSKGYKAWIYEQN